MDHKGEPEKPPTSITPAAESNFSQVIFPNVEKFYPPRTDVQCKFHRAESLVFNPKDWIGIFKVGWSNTSEYFTWISARTREDDSVLFKGYYLPRDNEFYQFCYVDHNGEVRGASIPFQFCHNVPEDENDVLMVTTEMEMMMINEENAELKKAVEKLTEEKSLLQEKVSSLQNENQAQAEKIQNLQDDLRRPTETTQRLETENMELTVQVKNLEHEKEMMSETIQSLNIDLQMLRNQEEKLLSEIKEMETFKHNIQEEKKLYQNLQTRIESLDEEREKLGSELRRYKEQEQKLLSDRKELEKSLEKSMAEKNLLKSEAVAKQKIAENFTYTVNQCKEENVKLKAELELQACALEKEKKQKENLRQLLDKEVKKVIDQERNMAQNTEKLRAAEETLIGFSKQIDSLKAENENKMKQMGMLHLTIASLEGEVKRMKEECKSKMEAERRAREARTRIRSTEEKMEDLELQLAKQQDTCRQQGEEILTLRNALELREEEIHDMKDLHKRNRTEIDELHGRLLGRGPGTSLSSSLIFGNPYEGNNPHFSREYGSSSTSRGPPSPLSCPICQETFLPHERQILEDHVMCHCEDEARP
ncbi:calcium-binding and coiled-coil domain-containing protein 2 [Hyla sarda]|uniref:calcium-binding and coiled-coil domain-containing protein 2 n=1 Tax=Hyla sarda TaxID=327740 RepID=UPI0024C4525D|nr:calcium-binding and coiled-coil domain-containing protein 2 [Hyla sarda]